MSNIIEAEVVNSPTTTQAVVASQGSQPLQGMPPRSIIADMAARYGMEPARFKQTLQSTVIKGNCTDEQFAAFMLVARQYDLNPFTKEIYAFPSQGGIQPIVSIDGWMKMINTHPCFDGMGFDDHLDDGGKLVSITCTIHRKDRSHPICVTEYMSECARNTDVWRKWPARMLRHKAAIQAARYAFGFSGIMEEDEYERMSSPDPQDTPTITPEQRDYLASLIEGHNVPIDKLCTYLGVNALSQIKASDYQKAIGAIERRVALASQSHETGQDKENSHDNA